MPRARPSPEPEPEVELAPVASGLWPASPDPPAELRDIDTASIGQQTADSATVGSIHNLLSLGREQQQDDGACARLGYFLLDLVLFWIVYPACAIILFDSVFPEKQGRQEVAPTCRLFFFFLPFSFCRWQIVVVWVLSLLIVLFRLYKSYVRNVADGPGRKERVADLFFDGLMWTIRGSIAYGLVISHQLQNGEPQIGVVKLLAVTLGYHTVAGRPNHCVASSEVFYPAAVFVFLGLLRSWEHAAYPVPRHQLRYRNLVVSIYRWMLVRSRIKGTLLSRICCECWNNTAEKELEEIVTQINKGIEELNFLTNELTAKLPVNEFELTAKLRLNELELTLIENVRFEKFKDHRADFVAMFWPISPRKTTRTAIQSFIDSVRPAAAARSAKKETTDRLLNLDRQSSAEKRSKAEAELAEQHLITQPIVYAILKLRVDKMQRHDATGAKKGPVDETTSRSAPFMCASDIVRMIVLRSKADQIMLHRWTWWSVVIVSWVHAALPILRHLFEKPYAANSVDPRSCGIDWNSRSWWNAKSTIGLLGLAAFFSLLGAGLVFHCKKQTMAGTTLGVVGIVCASCAVVFLTGFMTQNDYPGDWIGFLVNYSLTFSITMRLAQCFEDCYEQYRRMRYFLQLVPWPTMERKHLIRTDAALLPTFELNSVMNIEAWNKMRIYLARHDLKSIQRRQVSVVWLLIVWLLSVFYQLFKFFDPNQSSIDTESVFQISNTFQLLVALSIVLYYGKCTNELQRIGFEHVLRVSQAAMVSRSAHFLLEHHNNHKGDIGRADLKEYYSEEDCSYLQLIKTTDQVGNRPTTFPQGTALGHEQLSMELWLQKNCLRASQDEPFARTREFYLIESLVETVRNEHASGDRDHWGAEDRRARLLFINMDQSTLYSFWASVLSALFPVLYRGIASLYNQEEDTNLQGDVARMNMTCSYEPSCLSAKLSVEILEYLKRSGAGT